MEITTSMVKELREATGAGILDCRQALEATDGVFESAVSHLREQGLSEAAEKRGRQASEGVVEAYIHHGSRIGVLLELNCETDFVARTDEFQDLAHDLALHIAFAAPHYLTREDIPEEVIEEQKDVYRKQAVKQEKPEHVIDQIVEGRVEKFCEETCLMEQPFVRDDDRTIKELITESIATLGENVVVSRFERYEIGKE